MNQSAVFSPGAYTCDACSYVIALDHGETYSTCPHCGADGLHRASIFAAGGPATVDPEPGDSTWLQAAHSDVKSPGRYLAALLDGSVRVFELSDGLNWIGRGASCDIEVAHPTVSRRHAFVSVTDDSIEIFDDRSLNGTFVNGERVESHVVADRDDVTIGGVHLHLIESPNSPAQDADVVRSN